MPPLELILNFVVIIGLLVYWGVAFVLVYHLTRFGIGVQPKRFVAIFFFGSIALSSIAILLFTKIDLGTLFSKLS